MNDALYSNASTEWSTPSDLFATLDREFGFSLDPCATPANAKCPRYFTKDDDGLTRPWCGPVFMNPPYGREIGRWIEKAYLEGRQTTVVGLVPARTDTIWWHDFVMQAGEIRLIRGRLTFDGPATAGHNAPFPSAVVVWRPGAGGCPRVSSVERVAGQRRLGVAG